MRDPRAARLLSRRGHGALLPFLDRSGIGWFFVPGASGGGLVPFGQAGRVAVVLGDPIGDAADAWAAFDAFLVACRRKGMIPGVYQATGDAIGLLEARGFRSPLVGSEAVVELEGFDLLGARRANLRHTVTRARRGGIEVGWYQRGLAGEAPSLAPALGAIDEEWRGRAGPALGFTISRFEPSDLVGDIAVAVARDGEGRPVAFATFRPTGADRGYVLDLMRRRRRDVPGALESCIATAAAELRRAGVPRLSLGLAPLSGWDAEPSAEERLLAGAAGLVGSLYDVSGLAFFKDKFGPRWEPRHLAARGRFELLAVGLALLRLHLAPPGTPVSSAVLDAIDGLLPRPTRGDPADGNDVPRIRPPGEAPRSSELSSRRGRH